MLKKELSMFWQMIFQVKRVPLFLGKDVVLDLNGYTLKYADADYEHIPNAGFEKGLEGWDISKAPGAKVVYTADVHVFLGDRLLSLQAGDEITSPMSIFRSPIVPILPCVELPASTTTT